MSGTETTNDTEKSTREPIDWFVRFLGAVVVVGIFGLAFAVFQLRASNADDARGAAEQASETYGVEVDLVKAGTGAKPASSFSIGSNDPLVTKCTWEGLGEDDFSLSCGGQGLDPSTLYRTTR